jgi:hypothetical protein
MFHELRGMVFNFARRFDLEFDDCLQDACVIMLEIYPRIPAECANIGAYLNRCVRGELYRRLRKEPTLSLDAPIAPDSEETFADMLANFVEQDTRRSEQVAKTVHAALHNLSLEVQLHAASFYGLGSFTPALPRKSIKVAYGRQKHHMRASLKRSFHRNPQVLALMR